MSPAQVKTSMGNSLKPQKHARTGHCLSREENRLFPKPPASRSPHAPHAQTLSPKDLPKVSIITPYLSPIDHYSCPPPIVPLPAGGEIWGDSRARAPKARYRKCALVRIGLFRERRRGSQAAPGLPQLRSRRATVRACSPWGVGSIILSA